MQMAWVSKCFDHHAGMNFLFYIHSFSDHLGTEFTYLVHDLNDIGDSAN